MAMTKQVDAFLEAHDSGLTDADKEVAKGTLLLPIKYLFLEPLYSRDDLVPFPDLINAEPVK